MTKKLKSTTRNGERTMAIELKIGTRGTRRDIVRTKYGLMCSLSDDDIVTYMGAGIWDLRPKHKTEEYY